MYLHLDPLGGIAGDMFAAALLDAFPELFAELEAALAATEIVRLASIHIEPHDDHALTGSRFEVRTTDEAHPHRLFSEIRTFLDDLALDSGVRDRSIAIFGLLAEAEGRVHGVAPDAVTFHEVGAWDSITDVVTAAWLIEAVRPTGWSCDALPLGSGRVESAHGPLPVPAPATALLLEGFPCVQDGVAGERVTPTGAAILRHLAPDFGTPAGARTLRRSGIGFGSQTLDGISNVLRVLAFDESPEGTAADRVAVCEFELDDQTPEDLGVAIDRLRGEPGVIDVLQAPVFGKKGRVGVHVRILANPSALETVLEACFVETSTLGVRWQIVRRAVLPREKRTDEVSGVRVHVKTARRPDGTITDKAAMDDLAGAGGGRAAREMLRRSVEGGGGPDG
ncbi:MAG: LarC family nickel insertion protein [Gemmatimonadota bacterium]